MKCTITVNDLYENKKLSIKGIKKIDDYKKKVKELILNGVAFDFDISDNFPKNVKLVDCIESMCLLDIYNEAREKMGDKFIKLK
jgi:hypothetical protein